MRIIDANVVLRYLLNDHEEYSPKARQIIENETVEVPIEVLCIVSLPDISVQKGLKYTLLTKSY
jgi:predicted nucleic-acid-binding protein